MAFTTVLLNFIVTCGIFYWKSCESASSSLIRLQDNNSNDKAVKWTQFNGTAATTSGIRLYIQIMLQQQMEDDTLKPKSAQVIEDDLENTLEAIVIQELNGNWTRSKQLLELLNQTQSMYLKQGVYKALWRELQQSQLKYNPYVLIDFYKLATAQNYLNDDFKEDIRQLLITRCAQILEAPFHTADRSNFPIVSNILLQIQQFGNVLFNDIMNTIYDAVLLLERPRTVMERVSQLLESEPNLLANAYLKLIKRNEIVNSTEIQEKLLVLLRYNFELLPNDMRTALGTDIYAHVPTSMRLLYTLPRICLRNATDDDIYIYECPQTYLMCSNGKDPKRATYNVTLQVEPSYTLFAFSNPYWSNRYIRLELNGTGSQQLNTTITHEILKNVYSHEAMDMLRIRYFDDLIAIYDTKEEYVLCGGNPIHWDGDEHHVYTRNARDFDLYRNECLWRVENCSF